MSSLSVRERPNGRYGIVTVPPIPTKVNTHTSQHLSNRDGNSLGLPLRNEYDLACECLGAQLVVGIRFKLHWNLP